MPRQMRREFAAAIDHGRNRGDRREEIFRDERDRRMFLSTLAEACWPGRRGGVGPPRCGTQRWDAQEAKAGRLPREEMALLVWHAAALRQAGNGDERKARLAAPLRKETTRMERMKLTRKFGRNRRNVEWRFC